MKKGQLFKKIAHYLMIGLLLVLAAGFVTFLFVNVNRPILDAKKATESLYTLFLRKYTAFLFFSANRGGF